MSKFQQINTNIHVFTPEPITLLDLPNQQIYQDLSLMNE